MDENDDNVKDDVAGDDDVEDGDDEDGLVDEDDVRKDYVADDDDVKYYVGDNDDDNSDNDREVVDEMTAVLPRGPTERTRTR